MVAVVVVVGVGVAVVVVVGVGVAVVVAVGVAVVERAMTPEEQAAISALSMVTFVPGIPAKRFAREMAQRPDDYCLSPRQLWYLAYNIHRYRRQIGRNIVEWAVSVLADYEAGPPPSKERERKPKLVGVKGPSKFHRLMELALERPEFGNLEQAQAGRQLARRKA